MTTASLAPRTAWRERVRAATVHLALSALVAALAAVAVFWLWYPSPYGQLAGGRELFTLLVTVDVVMGPLITLAVFDRRKPWAELRRDLAVVGLLQLAALGYGLWTVAAARPVHLVFEFDRFRVVHAVDIPDELLAKAPPGVLTHPWRGPTPLAVREFKDAQENFEATMAAVNGLALAARPDLWQTYEAARPRVLAAAQPVARLKGRFPAAGAQIDNALAGLGRTADGTAWLPVMGRREAWTVLLDARTAAVVGFVPLDSF